MDQNGKDIFVFGTNVFILSTKYTRFQQSGYV